MCYWVSFVCLFIVVTNVCVVISLFVGGLMSNLRYSCLFTYTCSGVQHILCCVFVLFFFALYPYVASFSGLSTFIYN